MIRQGIDHFACKDTVYTGFAGSPHRLRLDDTLDPVTAHIALFRGGRRSRSVQGGVIVKASVGDDVSAQVVSNAP